MRHVECSITDWLVWSISQTFTATRANLGFQLGRHGDWTTVGKAWKEDNWGCYRWHVRPVIVSIVSCHNQYYKYKLIAFSKPRTLNPQTSLALQIVMYNYCKHFWLYGMWHGLSLFYSLSCIRMGKPLLCLLVKLDMGTQLDFFWTMIVVMIKALWPPRMP